MYAWNPLAVALGRFITERRQDKHISRAEFGHRIGFSATLCSFVEYARMYKMQTRPYSRVSFGQCLAAGLGLEGESARRFQLCYRILRHIELLRREQVWQKKLVTSFHKIVLKEPELAPILWPSLLLMNAEEMKAAKARYDQVDEAYLVQRVRDYILVTYPPIFLDERREKLQTAA